MTVLDHTIVNAADADSSAAFLTEILGPPAPQRLGPFVMVRVGASTLDFTAVEGPVHPQHYAFLVTEADFDSIFERIRDRDLRYWADPHQTEPGKINTWDGGRGIYFEDRPPPRSDYTLLRHGREHHGAPAPAGERQQALGLTSRQGTSTGAAPSRQRRSRQRVMSLIR